MSSTARASGARTLAHRVRLGSAAGHRSAEIPEPGEPQTTEAERAEFRRDAAAFLASGIHAALAHLNARTRFRYTAIYQLERERLRGLCAYDRENPAIVCSAPGSEASGMTTSIQLRLPDGQLAGVICHTDTRPRLLLQAEREKAEAVASLFAHWLADRGVRRGMA